MRKIEPVLDFIDSLNDWLGKIVSYLCIAVAVMAGYEIVLRYVFNAPSIWVDELTTYIDGIYIVMGGAYALRHNAHVNMDMLYSRLSPRGKAILDLVTSTFFFAFVIAMLWKGWDFAWLSLKNWERSCTYWEPPIFPFKIWIPIGAMMLMLQGVVKFIRDLLIAINREELK